jgi:hypothetical protein
MTSKGTVARRAASLAAALSLLATGLVPSVAAAEAPSQGRPTILLAGGFSYSHVPLAIRWPAAIPSSAPIADAELLIEQDGVVVLTRRVAATSRALTRIVEAEHQFRVGIRATDTAGHVSELAWSKPFEVRRFDNTSPTITYSSGWFRSRDVHWTKTAGARARFTFTGRAFAIVAPVSTSRGALDVWLDGRLIGRATLTVARTAQAQVVFRRNVTPGRHTLELRAIGPPDLRVDVDAISTLR